MGAAIGQVLPLAVAVALDPIPIVAVVHMRGEADRGRDHGLHVLTRCQRGALTAA
jgi:hypothetical protein